MTAEFGSDRVVLISTELLTGGKFLTDEDGRTLIYVEDINVDPCKVRFRLRGRQRVAKFGDWWQVAAVDEEGSIKEAVIKYLADIKRSEWVFCTYHLPEAHFQFATSLSMRKDLNVVPKEIGIWHNLFFIGVSGCSDLPKGEDYGKI